MSLRIQPRLSYTELDAIPYIDENNYIIPNKRYERVEQDDANELIPPDAVILELGGRYGTVSAVINHKLNDPTQHVVVEPDPLVQGALRYNRETHLCHFFIVNGILSGRKKYLENHGYGTFCKTEGEGNPVPNYTLEELASVYPTKPFTHLVADCEGGLLDFFEEYPEFLQTLRGIYFESDNQHTTILDYTPIYTKLKEWGFEVKKKAGAHQYWEKGIPDPQLKRKRLTLKEIQAIPYKTEKNTIFHPQSIESEEQKDADLLIPSHAKVLELGGRYGLAASAINHKLDNPTQHLVVEPDPIVQDSLRENRDSHFCHYSIFHGAISRKPLYFYQAGFCSYCSTTPSDDSISCLSLEEVQRRFSIPEFTHLVADCEGGFADFFEENQEFVKGLEAIYFEQDNKGSMKVDYIPIQKQLQEWGFVQKKDGFRQYWMKEKLAPQTPGV